MRSPLPSGVHTHDLVPNRAAHIHTVAGRRDHSAGVFLVE